MNQNTPSAPTTLTAKGEPSSSDQLPDRKRLDESLAKSLAWKAVADWTSQILTWSSLLIVVRLLTPADFGIVGMAVVLLPYLRFLSDFGISRTVVTLRDLTEDQLAQLNSVTAIMGLVCFGLACLFAKPVELFFRTPGLASVVIVTCLAVLPQGLRSVSEGILAKEMRFPLLSLYEAIRSIVAALITLILAIRGFGYWALVWGNVLATFLRCGLVLRTRPVRFAKPVLSAIREPLIFGWHVLVSTIALNSYERLDNVTAGRVLGKSALGIYAMAWNLSYVPLEKVTSLVTTVVPSYFAAVRDDPSALRRYLRTLTEALSLATFPATIGLGLVARELIPIALGKKWSDVILPLELLTAYATVRSITPLFGRILTALGNARYVMWNDLLALGLLPTAFVIGSHWGVAGIACGWVIGYPFVAIPIALKTFRTIDMSFRDYFQALRPAVDGTVVMILLVVALKFGLHGRAPLILQLIAEILTGAIAYCATVYLLHKPRVLAFVKVAQNFRQARAEKKRKKLTQSGLTNS
jgi:O-antigen/teichoic acid export membrane protein